MCASPASPRHAHPRWMGGGSESKHMPHTGTLRAAPNPSAARRYSKASFQCARAFPTLPNARVPPRGARVRIGLVPRGPRHGDRVFLILGSRLLGVCGVFARVGIWLVRKKPNSRPLPKSTSSSGYTYLLRSTSRRQAARRLRRRESIRGSGYRRKNGAHAISWSWGFSMRVGARGKVRVAGKRNSGKSQDTLLTLLVFYLGFYDHAGNAPIRAMCQTHTRA